MAAVVLSPSVATTDLDSHPIYGARPVLRGRFHQAAALLSVPLGLHLVGQVDHPGAQLPVLAYALTWTLMLTASAAYHRLAQGVVARFWMRRVDHSMILVHIAGGTTPIAVLGVGGSAGRVLLVVSWATALLGVGLKMTRLTADADPAIWCFPALGWLPLLATPALVAEGRWGVALLLVAATATYSAGAVCFARKCPDPAPTIFGYHEVWHVFTLLAGGLQLLLTIQLAG